MTKKKKLSEDAVVSPLPDTDTILSVKSDNEAPASVLSHVLPVVEMISQSDKALVEHLPKPSRAAPAVAAPAIVAHVAESVRKPREKKKPWMEAVGSFEDAQDSKTQVSCAAG